MDRRHRNRQDVGIRDEVFYENFGRDFGDKYELITLIKSLSSGNIIFEYETYLVSLDASPMAENSSTSADASIA